MGSNPIAHSKQVKKYNPYAVPDEPKRMVIMELSENAHQKIFAYAMWGSFAGSIVGITVILIALFILV